MRPAGAAIGGILPVPATAAFGIGHNGHARQRSCRRATGHGVSDIRIMAAKQAGHRGPAGRGIATRVGRVGGTSIFIDRCQGGIGGGGRIVDRRDGDGNGVAVGQGATGAGIAQVGGEHGQGIGPVVIGRGRIDQPVERRIDLRRRAGQGDTGAGVAGDSGTTAGNRRQGAVQHTDGGLQHIGAAHTGVLQVGHSDGVGRACAKAQRGVFLQGLRSGQRVDGCIIDRVDGNGDAGGGLLVAGVGVTVVGQGRGEDQAIQHLPCTG